MRKYLSWLVAAAGFAAGPVNAAIVASSETYFVLRHEATSELTPEQLWQRLIKPSSWWHPEHTYSGKAENLQLTAEAGGTWREVWDTGSVTHGEVIMVQQGKVLRLNAPFGPLQGLGAYVVWTITVEAEGEGTRVIFDEVASGPPTAKLNELAKAVDGVKGEAIERLVR